MAWIGSTGTTKHSGLDSLGGFDPVVLTALSALMPQQLPNFIKADGREGDTSNAGNNNHSQQTDTPKNTLPALAVVHWPRRDILSHDQRRIMHADLQQK